MTSGPGTAKLAQVADLPPMLIQGQPGWRPREADGWKPGLTLAVGAHLLLAVGLALSVSWKLAPDEPAVEAELWSEIPRGAPPSVAPPPPPPAPPAEPAPKVVAAPPPPRPVEPTPAPRPDIVTERESPRKKPEEKPRKDQKEPKEVFDTSPPKVDRKAEARKAAQEQARVEREEAAKKAAEKKAAEKKAAEQEARLAAEREALRKANLSRMMSELGGNGGSGAPGANAGPSAAYAGRIKARIKPNIVFTDQVSGNPLAKVEVRCAPDGRIMARKLVSSSGVAAWDEAVVRAVDRTEVLPRDENGRVPPVLLLEFRPNDF